MEISGDQIGATDDNCSFEKDRPSDGNPLTIEENVSNGGRPPKRERRTKHT